MIFSFFLLVISVSGIGLALFLLSQKYWPQVQGSTLLIRGGYINRRFIGRIRNIFNEEFRLVADGLNGLLERVWEKLSKRGRRERLYLFTLNLTEKILRRWKIVNMKLDIWLTKTIKEIQNHPLRRDFNPAYFKDLKDVIQQEGAVNGEMKDALPDFFDKEEEYLNLLSEVSDLNHFLNLARLYIAKGHYEEARWALLEALNRDIQDSVLLSLLKEIYEKEKGV